MFTISGSAHVPTQVLNDSSRSLLRGRIDCGVIMKEIPLTQGKVALVDDEDYEELSKYKWCAVRYWNNFYAKRYIRKNGKRAMEYMHREIMEAVGRACEVDHIDGDGLNNQRANLRICTHNENTLNLQMNRRNTSGYKGVSFDRKRNRYQAYIRVRYRSYHIGRYKTSIEAAIAYDDVARKIHGKFACLNFGDGIHSCVKGAGVCGSTTAAVTTV